MVRSVVKAGLGPTCPNCQSTATQVVNSAQIENGVRRRRQCIACGARWTTVEIPHEQYETIVKRIKHWPMGTVHKPTSVGAQPLYIIPPEKRGEVQRLKNKGLRIGEIADALGLKPNPNAYRTIYAQPKEKIS